MGPDRPPQLADRLQHDGEERRPREAAGRLRQLLNLEGGEFWTIPIQPTTPPETARISIDVDQAMEVAMVEQSELRQQNLAIANLDMARRVAAKLVKPRLDLQLRYGYNGLGGDTNIGGNGGIFDPRPPEAIDLAKKRSRLRCSRSGPSLERRLRALHAIQLAPRFVPA